MGVVKWIFIGLAAIVAILIGTGVYLYASDYAAEGTLTEKGGTQGSRTASFDVRFVPGIVTVPIPEEAWAVLCKGNFVEYNVRSGHYKLYDREGGTLLYEKGGSVTAPLIGQARCIS